MIHLQSSFLQNGNELLNWNVSKFRISLRYVNEAVARIEKSPSVDENDQSILEKLVKVNKNIGVVMAVDALMAGVDTVS